MLINSYYLKESIRKAIDTVRPEIMRDNIHGSEKRRLEGKILGCVWVLNQIEALEDSEKD